MQNLAFHIAYLLISHDCVILPGIGAFVAYETQADNAPDIGLFAPPIRVIGFNANLKHNDGLLSGLLMKERNCSYQESTIIVNRYCEEIQAKLQQQKEFLIPFVGSFHSSEEGAIIFTPSRESTSNACFYGLESFNLPVLHRVSFRQNNEEANRVVHSLSERWAHAARVIAATAAIFMLCATPISKENNPVREAGFLTASEVIESKQYVLEEIAISSTPLEIYRPATNVIPVSKITLEKPKTPQKILNTSKYYIIVGSFPSQATASVRLKKFTFGSRYTPAILKKDGRHRIYIRSFQHKADAAKFLHSFRANFPGNADAWIYSAQN